LIAPKDEADFIERGGYDLEEGLRLTIRDGIYPKDYRFQYTKVDKTVDHDFSFTLGSKTVRTIIVPGHSHGPAGFLFSNTKRNSNSFFSGDIVFHGGTIGLGNWPGCSLDNYRKYIPRLSDLKVGALFPGHFLWTLEDGQDYLDKAIQNLNSSYIPPIWMHNHPIR